MSEPTKFIEVVSLLVAMTGVFLAANTEVENAKQQRGDSIIERREENTREKIIALKRPEMPKYQDRSEPTQAAPKKKPRKGYLQPRPDWYEGPHNEWD
ncbi:MAG: hypothetical protein H7X92_03770 [Chitinophagales bacterium]|nr:hypothetical protein [Hyphomicrobiales bacterium]